MSYPPFSPGPFLSSVHPGVKTKDWDKWIFFPQDHVRLKTISPITKLITRGRHGPPLPHQIHLSFLEATRKPMKAQVRAMVLDLPHQRLYEPVEQYLVSTTVGTPHAVPHPRSPGSPSWPYTCHWRSSFTVLPWQIATSISAKEIFWFLHFHLM